METKNYLVEQDDSAKDLTEDYGSYIGTDNYYLHASGLCLFTDGVKDMATGLKCWWLIDKVASLCRQMLNKAGLSTGVWQLFVKDNQATLYCYGLPEPPDYDHDAIIYAEDIDFTDLSDGQIMLKVGANNPPIICLPVED